VASTHCTTHSPQKRMWTPEIELDLHCSELNRLLSCHARCSNTEVVVDTWSFTHPLQPSTPPAKANPDSRPTFSRSNIRSLSRMQHCTVRIYDASIEINQLSGPGCPVNCCPFCSLPHRFLPNFTERRAKGYQVILETISSTILESSSY
jgi:hypothetical protein